MIVNGAKIKFQTRSRIELLESARFLFGRQIFGPMQADTPLRQIYLDCRPMLLDEAPNTFARHAALGRRIHDWLITTASGVTRIYSAEMVRAIVKREDYPALKMMRPLIATV